MTENIIGLVDCDLLDNGTRHPNLVLMKLAGYFRDHKIKYKLIIDDIEDIESYSQVYVSKVFAFTKEPSFLASVKNNQILKRGGTGYYAEEKNTELFNRLRDKDMHQLENDDNLSNFNMAHQMPDYNLYNDFIQRMIAKGKKPAKYKDYQQFSIGFLTRGCIRKCPFCVNKNIDFVYNYSDLTDFVDESKPMIYLWDDNFLASKDWKLLLEKLQKTKKPFQFRQGLDIRLLNEEKATLLSQSRYHGDFIFAFDQIKDKDIIIRKLILWRRLSKKTTKLYLFCGFELSDNKSLYIDIINLFERIKILMTFGCLPYVMRHEDYLNHPLNNIYVQIARWCNQPQFYKKMSFKQFIDRNQHWTKTDIICKSKSTFDNFMSVFEEHNEELNKYFNMRYEEMINPELWNLNNEVENKESILRAI